ncbi:uncharacterized protein LOC134681962 [Mytilus trossulus]|uniref:uncharacterized protein LOC134681962 n=1 Tax=Mytilus trossulus TaxID=6551 RepID=UPI003004A659
MEAAILVLMKNQKMKKLRNLMNKIVTREITQIRMEIWDITQIRMGIWDITLRKIVILKSSQKKVKNIMIIREKVIEVINSTLLLMKNSFRYQKIQMEASH